MTFDRDVFVSYRHREPTASWVRGTLEPTLAAKGYETVLDVNDFVPGEVLFEQIESSSARARVTVAVVDGHYDDSWFTRYEAAISGPLIVVLRGDVERVPVSSQVVDLRASDDPQPVVEAVDAQIHRAFILGAEADQEFVSGFLVPGLDKAKIDVLDLEMLSRRADRSRPAFEALESAFDWSDRVIVVVSRAYLQDRADDARFLQQYESTRKITKTLPLILDDPEDPDEDFEIPLQYDVPLRVDMFDRALWYESLLKICAAFDVAPPRPDRAPPCPYPGMRPYQYADREERERFPFFGREHEVEDILHRLGRRRTAVVIGPSGSGKSSLVLAGLLPRIRDGALDGRPQPVIEVVRPDASVAEIRHALRQLGDHRDGARTRVLVVDQLEQALLAPGAAGPDGGVSTDDPTGSSKMNANERILSPDATPGGADFLDEIISAHLDDPELYLIATLRADFYEPLMVSRLWPHVRGDLVSVAPLRGEDLESAIRGPAAKRGVVIAESLVVRLASATENQPGLLPFLQETLRRLWGRSPWWYISLSRAEWDSGRFGVRRAISQHADDALRLVEDRCVELQLSEADGARIMRAILMRLVHFGADGTATRRRVPLDQLATAWPDRFVFDSVLEVLGDERILTTDTTVVTSEDAGGEQPRHIPVVDLSHDAIITGWDTFGRWIDEQRELEVERRRWAARVGPEPLTGVDLDAAEAWLGRAADVDLAVEPDLVEHIRRSRNEANRLTAQAERRRRRERQALVISVVVALTMAALGIFAWRQWSNAESAQRREAAETDRRVATQLVTAAASYEGGLPLQALLVRAADVIDENELGAVEMLVTAESDPGIARRIDATRRGVGFEALATLPDGRVVVGDGKGKVQLWNPDESSPAETEVRHGVLAIAADPNSSYVAVAGGDSTASGRSFAGSNGWVDLIDTSAPGLPSRRVTIDETPVSAVVFDGDDLITGSWSGTVAVIDVSDPSNPAVERTFAIPERDGDQECDIAADDRKVRSLAVDAERRWLVAGGNHCVVAVWNRESLDAPIGLVGHTSKVRAVTFVPGSSELLSTGDDATIRSWDLGSSTPVSRLLVGPAPAGDTEGDSALARATGDRVIAMCVAPDGSYVVTAGRDHLVRHWSRVDGELVGVRELPSHVSTVRGVSCPGGSTFASVAGDGVVVWDTEPSLRWGEQVAHEPSTDRGVEVAARSDGSDDYAVTNGTGLEIVGRDGAEVVEPGERAEALIAPTWSSDGSRLVAIAPGLSGRPDSIVEIAADDLEIVDIREASGVGRLHSLALTDRVVAAGMDDGEILLVDGDDESTLEIPTRRRVTALALLPEGALVAGDEGGTLLCSPPPHRGEWRATELGRAINALDTANGSLAVGTADGQILVFSTDEDGGDECDLASWPSSSPPVIHSSILDVELSSSGDLLVAATSSGSAEVWDVPRLRRVGDLTLPGDDMVRRVAIGAGAEFILLGGEEYGVLFDVEREGLRERLCDLAARNLTEDEEASFLPDARYHELAECV